MCFHRWAKWDQYETTRLSHFYSIPCKKTAVHQKRTCEKCGKMQDEWVACLEWVSITKNNIPEPKE